jgi:hypothetical protein
MRTLASLIIFATVTSTVLAGTNEIGMVRGVGYALVVVEKCTGVAPPADYVQRLRAGMTRSGIGDEDFRQGFASGAMNAEMQFQGKPPARECKDARALKAQIDKAFL